MTITSTTRKAGPFIGNGAMVSFPFSFKVFTASDLLVVQALISNGLETVLVLFAGYTVSLNADQNTSPGGVVKLPVALPVGQTLTVITQLPNTQSMDLTNQGGFYPKVINDAADRAVILIQQLAEKVSRTLQFGVSGSTGPAQTIPGDRANRFLSFDAAGNPITSSGTGADAGLRADLAGIEGAGLLRANPFQTQDSVNRERVSPRRFGCIGNGIVDDTVNFQKAVDYAALTGAALNLAEYTYRLTAPINSATGFRVWGSSVQPYQGALGTTGVGSWLFFDHAGVGFNVGAAALSSGFEIRDFGTRRNQPVPAPGWAPNPHDFDFKVNNCDTHIDNILLLNATKGIFLDNGNAGRLSFRRLRGQCFQVGLQIETSFDVICGDHLHLWPFWADNANVHAYTVRNLDAIYLKRCDNPKFTNVFSIFARSGIRLGQNAIGCTSKLKLTNADFDLGMMGLWVDPTATNGASGQITNMSHQGQTALLGSKMIHVEGNNSSLDFANTRTDANNQNGVRVQGANNLLRFVNLSIYAFDAVEANFPAVEASAGNRVEIAGKPIIGSGGGTGDRYGGAGLIVADDWRQFTPSVVSQTGTIGSFFAIGRFKVVGSTVSVKVAINIMAAGTGGGSILFSVPVGTTLFDASGSGRESAMAGKALQLLASGTQVSVFNYDNGYPGVTGAVINLDFSYVIAL